VYVVILQNSELYMCSIFSNYESDVMLATMYSGKLVVLHMEIYIGSPVNQYSINNTVIFIMYNFRSLDRNVSDAYYLRRI
jgi:hypothetical protein